MLVFQYFDTIEFDVRDDDCTVLVRLLSDYCSYDLTHPIDVVFVAIVAVVVEDDVEANDVEEDEAMF